MSVTQRHDACDDCHIVYDLGTAGVPESKSMKLTTERAGAYLHQFHHLAEQAVQ